MLASVFVSIFESNFKVKWIAQKHPLFYAGETTTSSYPELFDCFSQERKIFLLFFCPSRGGLLVFLFVGLLLLTGWRRDEHSIKMISGKMLYQNFLVEKSFACIMTAVLYVAEHTEKMLSHSPLKMLFKTVISDMLKHLEFYVAGSTMHSTFQFIKNC